MMKHIKIIFSLVFIGWALMLNGCGGSGGGSGTGSSPSPTPSGTVRVITAFSINGYSGVITGNRIAVTLPFGTNITALIATFTSPESILSVGGIPQINGVSPNDFTRPVIYTVTRIGGSAASSTKAANSSTSRTYTVTVTVASISAKAITAFSLGTTSSTTSTSGIITLLNISVKVPFGTDVTALVATFTTSGASVAVNGVNQVNGVTLNDFTNPVTYTVTAADGTTQNYIVTVSVAAASNNDILAYSLDGTPGVITAGGLEQNIVVKMPYGTNLNGLIATFITTGSSVVINRTHQISGTTQNDFTKSLVYIVTAADGTTRTYTVIVTVSLISSKVIDAYSFGTISGVITGQTIAVAVPFGTNVKALIATFTTTGENVTVGGIDQTSTVTPHDFTNPVVYTVIAADGSTAAYTVTVTVASVSAKAITAFAFGTTEGVIIGQNISVTMPFGTDVTDLIASFSTTGVSVSVGTSTQVSGTTRNNFTIPVTYVVKAADGTTQNYIVTVTVESSSAKAITAFAIAGTPGVITGFNIAVTVPFGTIVSNLGATFTTTGASVSVNGETQFSGTTSNNFTSPVTYVVTAADGTTQNYIVTVTIALSSAKAITAFSINGYNGNIVQSGFTIAVNIQFGTGLTDLIATFTATGDRVDVDGVQQNSGSLPSKSFTAPVVYTVVAADGTTQNYTVTVTNTADVWTWMSGGNAAYQFGVYGEKGTAAPGNVPGNREASVSWADSSGNLWLFGGQGYNSGFDQGPWNDLWKYNILSGQWTWVSGANSINQVGVYGEKGTPTNDTVPGSRIYSTSWIDSSGNLWLFGGDVRDASFSGVMNDLWKFNPETLQWTWISGAETRYEPGTYSGPDSVPGARQGSISWIDTSGNMWLFGGKGVDSTNSEGVLNDLWKYNPLTNKWTWISGSDTVGRSGIYGDKGTPSTGNIPGARQNSVSWIDGSGNLWLFGGLSPGGGEGGGATNYFNDLWKFNPVTLEWTWVSGSDQPNQLGVYGNIRVPSIDNIPGSRAYSISWIDTSGNLWLYGGYFFFPDLANSNFNDLWKYTPSTGLWTWVSGPEQSNQYGMYGDKGVPLASNRPGGRNKSISWTDASGDLWLFGGYGYSIANENYLNDLWKYHP